jgi:hypothetical protein
MSKFSNFKEQCPHCGVKLNDLYGRWQDSAFGNSSFLMECIACSKMVEITVHVVPEFEASKVTCARCQHAEVKAGHAYCKACEAIVREYSTPTGANP